VIRYPIEQRIALRGGSHCCPQGQQTSRRSDCRQAHLGGVSVYVRPV